MKKIFSVIASLLLAVHLPAQTMLVIVAGTGSGGGTPTLTCLPNAASGASSSSTTVTAAYPSSNAPGNLLVVQVPV